MADIDLDPIRQDGLSTSPQGHSPLSVPAALEPASGERNRLLVIGLVAGLIAGAASSFAGEMILKSYLTDLTPKLQIRPTAADFRRFSDAQLYSATLTFTTMGAALGLTLGGAGGMARRSALAGARAAMFGLVLGTAVAAPLSFVLLSIFFKNHDPQSGDLLLPLLTHGVIWSAIGAIGGLAFGLGLGRGHGWTATLLGGLCGAAAATIVYELVGALAFASDKTDQPLSSSIMTRAMARLLVTIFAAVGSVVALRQSKTIAAASAEPS